MYSGYNSNYNSNYASSGMDNRRRLAQHRAIGYGNSLSSTPAMNRGYYDSQYGGYNNNLYSDYNEPLYFEDRMFDDENLALTTRPTWRKSKMLANPDFGNYQFKKGYSAEVWLNDGETVVLSGHSRKKTYRTHYSPEYLRSFFFGWIGRLLRYFYLDRLFGLHIDTVKTMQQQHLAHSESNIFDAYKSIGHVTEDIPFAYTLGKLTKDSRVYTSIGNSYHNYIMSNLVLADTGPQLEHKIQCMYAERKDDNAVVDWVYMASGQSVYIYNQRELIACLSDGHTRTITHMLKMGKYLLTFSRDDHTCSVWDTSAEEFTLLRTHKLPIDSTISCVIHPHAYLDKILIGTVEGHIDLYNIRVGELVHRFDAFTMIQDVHDNVVSRLILRNEDEQEKRNASITSMCNSPTLDVVAIGLSDGQIILYNIRFDKIIFKLVHSPGPITSISFRTDAIPLLVSGNAKGEIAIWDLNKQTLLQLLSTAHSAAVTSLLFVPYEPVLISSGADNSLQTFIFDRPDKPRMENKREGHSKPPQHVKFYDPSGNWIVSAGSDQQLRLTSLVDRVTSQISQKLKEKKKRTNGHLDEQNLMLPAVTGLDTCHLRQDDWENMVTCHRDSNIVRLWNVKDMSISKKSLYSSEKHFGSVSSVCISVCGNFAFVGRTKGFVEKWNLQSGSIKAFCTEYVPKGDKDVPSLKIAHHGSVNGVAVDNTNAKVISGGYDGLLKIWDLNSCKLINKFNLGASVTKIVKSKVSNLIAVSTDSFEILIYDLNTDVLIRRYKKHEHTINDMTFSYDSRFLVSCCMGSSIIVYDIVAARVIDWLKVPKMATALDFHPEGLYLASCHADTVGISLWLNKLVFGNAIIQSVSAPMYVNLPMTSQEAEKIQSEEEETIERQSGEKMLEKRKRKREVEDLIVEDSESDGENDGATHNITGSENVQDILMLDEDFGKKMRLGDNIASRVHNNTLVSFSGIPKNKWYSIMHLDELRERNKVANQNETNVMAPFMLTSLPTLSGAKKFVKNDKEPQSRILGDIYSRRIDAEQENSEEGQDESMVDEADAGYSSSDIMALIRKAKQGGGYIPVINKLKSMNPKDIDIAIRMMSVGDDFREFKDLLDFFIFMLQKRQHFDLLQAMLNLFLQVHSELMSKSNDLSLFDKLDELHEVQNKCWNPLDNVIQSSLCLSKYIQQLF